MVYPMFVRRKGKDHGWHLGGRPVGLLLVIVYKALWGLIEVSAGAALIFSSVLIAQELTEDPQDLLVRWLLTHVHFSPRGAVYLGTLMILLGVGKLILAVGLWYRSYFVRNLGMFFFSSFALYGTYHVIIQYSFFTLIALSADVCILVYFWKVLPKHFRRGEIY